MDMNKLTLKTQEAIQDGQETATRLGHQQVDGEHVLLGIPDFRLEDSNLHTIIPVAPWEAVLGSQATIRTLDGDVTVKIPAGSSSGRKVRLRGKGFPGKNGVNGDLFAEIKIMVPTELADRDRELFEQLAEESEFNPRGQR